MSTISAVSSSGDAWSNMKAKRADMQQKMFAKVDADGSGGIDKTELQTLVDKVAKKTGVTSTSTTDELFSKVDTNGDGTVSSDELSKSMKDIMPPPSTMEFAQSRSDTGSSSSTGSSDDLFGKIDTDGSGTVSKDELQSLMDKMSADKGTSKTDSTTSSDLFAKLDSNGDGSLSKTEFEAARPQGGNSTQGAQGPQGAGGPPPGGPPPAGGAGGASSASTTYDPLDTNEDGVVSLAERLAGNTQSTDAVTALLKAIDTNGDKTISANESDAFITKLTAQLEDKAATAQSTNTPSASSKTSQESVDLAELVTQAYEQIASGLAQQTKGTNVSAVV